MPTFTPPSDPAPNKLTKIHNMVWSIPNIRSEILLYLSDKDVITLLRTSKIHFQAAVERLYRVFPYKEYHKLVKRCTDKARKQCYWSAVRTVELLRTTSPSEWTRYLVPFPNATCLQIFDSIYDSDPFILHRTFKHGKRQYTIVHPGDHSVWDVRKALRTSEPLIDIPKSWQSRRNLDIVINCEDRELNVEEQAEMETSLRDLSNNPQLFIKSVYIYHPLDATRFLQVCRAVHATGRLNIHRLKVHNLSKATLEIIQLTASNLISIHFDLPEQDQNPNSLDHLLRVIDWTRFSSLKYLYISCQAASALTDATTVPTQTFTPTVPTQRLAKLGIHLYTQQLLLGADLERNVAGIRQAVTTLSTFLDHKSPTTYSVTVYRLTYFYNLSMTSHILEEAFRKELRRLVEESEARARRLASSPRKSDRGRELS